MDKNAQRRRIKRHQEKTSKLTIRFARYFNREIEEEISNMIAAPVFR